MFFEQSRHNVQEDYWFGSTPFEKVFGREKLNWQAARLA